jgi:hypothetical protein
MSRQAAIASGGLTLNIAVERSYHDAYPRR